MKHKELNTSIPLDQMIEEATTIEVWEKVKPEKAQFKSFSLMKGKVISAYGYIKVNGEVRPCIWNYQGICLDKKALTVIEEGCL